MGILILIPQKNSLIFQPLFWFKAPHGTFNFDPKSDILLSLHSIFFPTLISFRNVYKIEWELAKIFDTKMIGWTHFRVVHEKRTLQFYGLSFLYELEPKSAPGHYLRESSYQFLPYKLIGLLTYKNRTSNKGEKKTSNFIQQFYI